MKVYTNQCPLCLHPVSNDLSPKRYPCIAVCCNCGGMSVALSHNSSRAGTLKEIREIKAGAEIPDHVRQWHDEAVADKWG